MQRPRGPGGGNRLHVPEGYLLQQITSDGRPLYVEIQLLGSHIYVEVWRVQMGRTNLYLMDTAVDANDPWNRCISNRLYTDDPEQRLKQEIVLGMRGVRVLKALGMKPVLEPSIRPKNVILERERTRPDLPSQHLKEKVKSPQSNGDGESGDGRKDHALRT